MRFQGKFSIALLVAQSIRAFFNTLMTEPVNTFFIRPCIFSIKWRILGNDGNGNVDKQKVLHERYNS